MRARARSAAAGVRTARFPLGCAVLAAAFALTLAGCGGDQQPAEAGGTQNPAGSPPSVPLGTPAPTPELSDVPKVRAADVKPLVGRWVGPNGDHFRFGRDGTGVWQKGGQELWKGKVIPEGDGKFRFSWQGGDPRSASYWGVTLTGGGSKLTFAGTNQTYRKAQG